MTRSHPAGLETISKALYKTPAYVTLPLAIAAYVLLTAYARPPLLLAETSLPGLRGARQINLEIIFLGASLGRIVIPLILSLAAIVWTFNFLKAKQLQKQTIRAAAADVMQSLTWEEFERVTAQAFANRGYDAQLTTPGADGGVDVVIKKANKTFFVQCKHWKSSQVSADVVRSLYGVIQKHGANGAYVVTSGGFTNAAKDFARDLPIWLITGDALRTLIKEGSSHSDGAGKLDLHPRPLNPKDKACPRCQKLMTIRTSSHGDNAGQKFWGCTDYPTCKATRPF